MSQTRESFEDYDGFVEKFKPKRTTVDCYTPPEVYAVVLDYVRERWGVDEADVVRPFWPGGDFETSITRTAASVWLPVRLALLQNLGRERTTLRQRGTTTRPRSPESLP